MINRQRLLTNLFGAKSFRRFYSEVAAAEELPSVRMEYKSLWEITQSETDEKKAQVANDAQYLQSLRRASLERGAYKPLQAKESDIPEVRRIKERVNRIVERELALQDFKHDQAKLAGETYNEVITRKNFFFQVDETKRDKNLVLSNVNAPGNKHRVPHYILPHEHIHHQHFIDTTGADDDDKRFELYGYYSYLVDLHIAQIRPENLDEKSYVPKRLNHVEHSKSLDSRLNNRFFEYYHRWREPTRSYIYQTQEINFQETLANRPTTDHYDHDKGGSYEIEWKEHEKFPHVANRLGYPTMREEPIERILGLERAPAHPGYQWQPFIQTPSMSPDPTLNFKMGETIYENRNVLEWVRFWKTMGALTFAVTPGFYVFEMYAGDGAPSIDWMSENWLWHKIPKQFQDGAGWELEEIRYCDDHDYMNIQYSGKRGIARPSHTFYMCGVLVLLQNMNWDYVSRMHYNRDKDLVFVYKPDGLWNETEYIYETHHLEQMVPHAVTAIKNQSMQRDDGILTVFCMNTKDNLKFYNEDKYWNMDLKDEFMEETRGLWRNNFSNKYNGSIFTQTHVAGIDDKLDMEKVHNEMQAAIAKHGEARAPVEYERTWEERVDKERAKIAASAL